MPTFQATYQAYLPQTLPPDHLRPIRVCSHDERRFGVVTGRRRRTAHGVPPLGAGQHVFAWCDVSGAVALPTGAWVFMDLSSLHAAGFPLVGDAVAAAFPDRLHLLLRDTRGVQTAQRRLRPATVRLVCWPPDGPALNPIARGWRDLTAALAGPPWPHQEAPPADSAPLPRGSQAATLPALTGAPDLIDARHALQTERRHIRT